MRSNTNMKPSDITAGHIADGIVFIVVGLAKMLWLIVASISHTFYWIVKQLTLASAFLVKHASLLAWSFLKAVWGVIYVTVDAFDKWMVRTLRRLRRMSHENLVRMNKGLALATIGLFVAAFNVNTSYIKNPYAYFPGYSEYMRASPIELNLRSADMESVTCLAMNIYHEARNEPIEGQMAVAFVTFNRVNSSKHPNNVCSVVYEARQFNNGRTHCQFSWYCDGKDDTPRNHRKWAEIQNLATNMIINQDILLDVTHGATFYQANYSNHPFFNKLEHVVTIGAHLFYLDTNDNTFDRTAVVLSEEENLSYTLVSAD